MKEFFTTHSSQLLSSLIAIVSIIVVRFISRKTVRRIGNINNFFEGRTKLIAKYISVLLIFFGIIILVIIWGVNFTEIALLFTSFFAVLGVALVAQWSIISNILAGVILFFSFPFKIGDKIKIMDNEIMDDTLEDPGVFIIESITAFHVHLRKSNGSIMTYPNNLMLQKGISLIQTYEGES